MTKTWTQRIAALMFALAIVVSTSVFAEDDVFVDEGDGDFDTMPVAPAEPAAPVAQQAAPAPDMSAVEEELATPTIVEEKAPENTSDSPALSNEDLFDDEDPAAKPVVAQEEKPAPVKKAAPAKTEKKVAVKKAVPAKKEKKVAKATKSFKKGKGYFAYTSDVCKMVRAPASTKGLGETRASKKIWVEDVDSKWVKVWNKDGKEAFLSRDCLK